MKIKAMSVAYERPISLRILIDCFLMQTIPNWELIVVHDGVASPDVHKTISLYNDSRIQYRESPKRYGVYGHPNRKIFLSELTGDKEEFIILTNDDNYYVPIMAIEVLTKCKPDVGMVYFDTVHSHFLYNVLKTQIKVDMIDVGSFAVRADVAKAVGFTNFAFNGDGYYACDCAKYCKEHGLRTEYIPKPLFVHN
jgi:glycosyltransferase involved in cell wall biosynthesis